MYKNHSLILAGMVLLSLAVSRGEHFAGFEVLGQAQANLVIEELGFLDALSEFFKSSRTYSYFDNESGYWYQANSIIFGFIPGLFQTLQPNPYWTHIWSLILTLGALHFIGKSLHIERKLLYSLLLCSPLLLSYALVGFPYLSIFLTFGLSIALVNSRITFFKEIFCWALMGELFFHSYDLAKVAYIVPLCACLTISEAEKKRRLLWFIASLCLILIAFNYQSLEARTLTGGLLARSSLWPQSVINVFQELFAFNYTTPWLFILAALGFLTKYSKRNFFLCLIIISFALLIVASSNSPIYLHSRRFILFEFLCLLAACASFKELEKKIKVIPVLILFLGCAHTLYETGNYLIHSKRPRTPLPFAVSPYDFQIDTQLLSDVDKIAHYAAERRLPILITYGYSRFSEAYFDPQAVPERLLIKFGAKKFKEKFFFLDPKPCRHSCVPSYQEEILAQKKVFPFGYTLLIPKEYNGDHLIERYLNKSSVTPLPLQLERFHSYRVMSIEAPGPIPVRPNREKHTPQLAENGFHVWTMPMTPFIEFEYAYPERTTQAKSITQENFIQTNQPSSLYLKSFLLLENESLATLNAVFSGEIKILMNGQTVYVSRASHNNKRIELSLSLEKGLQQVEILNTGYYQTQVQVGFKDPYGITIPLKTPKL